MKKTISVLLACALILGITAFASANETLEPTAIDVSKIENEDGSFSLEMSREPHVEYGEAFSLVFDENGELQPQMLNEGVSSITRVFACSTCGSTTFYKSHGYSRTVIVGSADTCYISRWVEPIYCGNDHHIMDDYTDSAVSAHSFGSLNADGYTITCRTCGYTTRN